MYSLTSKERATSLQKTKSLLPYVSIVELSVALISNTVAYSEKVYVYDNWLVE